MTRTVTAPSPSPDTDPAARGASGPLDLDALYRDARDDVLAYATTLLRDASAAEEATAVAFERACRKRRSYKPGRGSPRAWLFGIARNAALDELRRRRRGAELVCEPADEAADLDATVETALRRAAVRAALADLAPRERELVALKFHAGLDNAELAAVLGVTVSNAGTQLHRAMTKLREAVADA